MSIKATVDVVIPVTVYQEVEVVANPDEISEFEPGDGISVTAGRTDLVGIEGVTSLSEPLMRQQY
ncbi:hypothetical protein ACYJ1Y_18115 [Natrialbaceae archaeon A-gly3]